MVSAAGDNSELGYYRDWVSVASGSGELWPQHRPSDLVRADLDRVLKRVDEPNPAVRVVSTWTDDGLEGRELEWSVGFGPATRAWVLRPAGGEVLPGILALHCHSHFTFFGKEKIADGAHPAGTELLSLRETMYSGRAWANDLARSGFVVMVHDAFMWGTRRFEMPGETTIDAYNEWSITHEDIVAKFATALGTNVAAIVNREDRIALGVLRGLSDVAPSPLGTVGFSGGGLRAILLNATSEEIGATAVIGMMSTLRPMAPDWVTPHTWMLWPEALAPAADLPAIAASRSPRPLLVHYGEYDPMFPIEGRHEAHDLLAGLYGDAPDAYIGRAHAAGHEYSREMQEQTADWFGRVLRAGHSPARGATVE